MAERVTFETGPRRPHEWHCYFCNGRANNAGMRCHCRLVRGIRLIVGPTGHILKCADWTRIGELVEAGLVRREVGGPGTYGHVDYFLEGGE